jgi:hypothetical protein
MTKRIEKDLEEVSVNLFVNEYGSLRAVYNRLYTIMHVYYSGRRQLVASGGAVPLEKLVQMRKDVVMRLERLDTLTKDKQFPQKDFAGFAKEKLDKMHLAIGVMETASLIGELSSYSKTIMDYMKFCCKFAKKFITILSDPVNQDLQSLKNNLIILLGQIDGLMKQPRSFVKEKVTAPLGGHVSQERGKTTVPLMETVSQGRGKTTVPLMETVSQERDKTTVPLSGPLSLSRREGVMGSLTEIHSDLDSSPEYNYKELQSAPPDGHSIGAGLNRQQKVYFLPMEDVTPSPLVPSVDEALNILDKINLFKSKSRPLKTDENNDAQSVTGERDSG